MTYFINFIGTLFGGFVGYCLTVLACASALMVMETGRDANHQHCLEMALSIGPVGGIIGAVFGLAVTWHVTSLNSDFVMRGHQ